MKPQPIPPQVPVSKPPKPSGGAPVLAILLACGAAGLMGLAVILGVAFLSLRTVREVGIAPAPAVRVTLRDFGEQLVRIDQPVHESRVYEGQLILVNAPVHADIRLVAQSAEINQSIQGDVEFTGQHLKLKPGGSISGDLKVSNAQVIEIGEGALLEGDLLVDNVNVLRILGDFRGNIAGNFQTLEWPRRDAESESEAE